MNLFKAKTLGTKITVPTVLVTMALLIGLGAFLTVNNRNSTRELINSKAAGLGNLLEKISAPYIVNYDYPSLEGFVKEAVKDPEVVFLVFYDAKNRPLTQSSREPADTSGNLVFQHQIKDPESQAALGHLKLGYSLETLHRLSRQGMISTGYAIFFGALLMIGGLTLVIRRVTRPLLAAITKLDEGADSVALAARQVAEANQQVAEGSSQQAASLEETSSSLEVTTSMTKRNADNAREADALMAQANQAGDHANRAMTDLNASIKEIAAASDATAKIVKTIDDIAFQTNLLALNAAVEAARAGEAGAGFAVVADEVRSLSRRAADAARETASLIDTTLNRVKQGLQEVDKTASAFAQVSQSTTEVKHLVAEIAAASQEQAQGVEQISKALTDIDQVVMQNAANTEESASAATELSNQAQYLKEAVITLVSIVGRREEAATTAAASPDTVPARALTPARQNLVPVR